MAAMSDAERDDLLPIGRFAREVGLTPSALRFYDEVGLLAPADTDAATGYRRYAPDQRAAAVLIRRLRAAGVGLLLVGRVVRAPGAEALRLLLAHRAELEATAGRHLDALDEVVGALG